MTGNSTFGLQELVSRLNVPVLLSWTVTNTDTLVKIHPVVFRGLSGALLRFFRVPVLFLAAASQFSPKGLFRQNLGS